MPADGMKHARGLGIGDAGAGVVEVPGYEIIERLGKGGMGEVYLARQLTLGRLVALKFLAPDEETNPEHDFARFRREAELMAKVSHPFILSIFDFGEADGRSYLVMEYVSGGDLRGRMKQEEPLPVDRVRSILVPVGEALAHLHRHGIIHRDLKPENILMHDGGQPRVTDFGIAVLRAGAGSLTRTGWGLGTLGYVAPEQQYRLKVDERADQFSLAALAYEMLTGHLPLGAFKPPSQLNPRLSRELDAVIVRALQENPKDRFATIEEFTTALDASLAESESARIYSSRRRRGARVALGVVLLAGLGTLLIAWQARRDAARPSAAPRVAPTPPQAAILRPATPAPVAKEARAAAPLAKVASPPSLPEELKQMRARRIWEERGRPEGEAGRAVQEEIWYEAERVVEKALKELAYHIWEERGSPKGAAGEAVKDEIWHEAERRLYKELSGKDAPELEAP